MKKIFLIIAVLSGFLMSCDKSEEDITILCWSGYNETDFKDYIESKVPNTNLKFITYTGGEDMLRKYLNNKTKFDLLVVDAEYGKILYDKKELKTINLNEIPEVKETIKNDYFEKFKYSKNTPGYISKDENYCIITRWGTLGIVGKESLVNDFQTEGYNVLLNKNYKNKITIFDWYLPNMGIFSLMYLNEKGIDKNPYELTTSELSEMYASIMEPIRPNVKNFYADLGLVIQSAYDDNTKMIPGIGEWAIGNNMLNGDKTRNWFIPEQGGIIWIEALAIPQHITDEGKLKRIHEIIKLFSTSELQSKLAWRQAYTSHVPNKKAYSLMSEEKQQILQYRNIESTLDGLYFRKVPEVNASQWISYWSQFKNN
ncbi:MAG: PotD/PotF family extracellular solute-binding protein [Bacteroidales bacterium]